MNEIPKIRLNSLISEQIANVRINCGGLMTQNAYEATYSFLSTYRPKVVVEIGTAHAATTVVIALCLQHSGIEGEIFSFEKIIGGSREKFGGIEENVRIIKENLEAYQVSDLVSLMIGDVSENADRIPAQCSIDALVIDADGRVDRDFLLFFNNLSAGAPIIVDDFRDEIFCSLRARPASYEISIDQKHRITYQIVSMMEASGMLERAFVVDGTWFGRKGSHPLDDLYLGKVLECYRGLVFGHSAARAPLRGAAVDQISRFIPNVLKARIRSILR